MTTDIPSAPDRNRRSGLALGSLFLAAFVVGTAELVVVGVLTLVAADLDVTVGTAGVLVSSYAVGIAVGGPVLTSLTIRLPRRTMLRAAFTAYLLGNVLAVFAASFGLLVLARVVTGSLHGLFIGVALAVATSLVSPDRMGFAVSLVLGGIAVSTAFGVPIGTLIGQSFGWQGSFVAVVALGVVALGGLLALVPATANTGVGGLSAQAHYALAPRVLAVLVVGFLLMGGQFAALTFITPFLEQVTGVEVSAVSIFLLVYGLSTAVGTLLGGRLADRNANLTLMVASVVVVLALGVMYLGGASGVVVAVALVAWGVAGFGLVPCIQYRAVVLAGPGRDLAASLPASATTGGIALGSVIGGWALESYGPAAPILFAAIVCAVAVPAAWGTTFLRPPVEDDDPAPADGPGAVADRTTVQPS